MQLSYIYAVENESAVWHLAQHRNIKKHFSNVCQCLVNYIETLNIRRVPIFEIESACPHRKPFGFNWIRLWLIYFDFDLIVGVVIFVTNAAAALLSVPFLFHTSHECVSRSLCRLIFSRSVSSSSIFKSNVARTPLPPPRQLGQIVRHV